MTKNPQLKRLLYLTAAFIVLELLIQQVFVHSIVNWSFYHFHLTQLQANFIFKMVEVAVVLGLNYFLTKQKIYFKESFTWLGLAFWIVVIALAIPYFSAENPVASFATGAMGGFSEEFLARGVLLGMFLTYFLKQSDGKKGAFRAVFYSNLIFALMHLTNLSHAPLGITLLQCFIAFWAGISYAIAYVTFGSIWPAIALHFLDDVIAEAVMSNTILAGHLNQGFAILKILVIVVPIVYLLVTKKKSALVRKINADAIK